MPTNDIPMASTGLMEQMNFIIAKHMNELTHEDREKLYFDLHGVPNHIEETEELIRDSLDSMHLEVKAINKDMREAYDLAESINTEYVNSPTFRLCFLRGERFDARQAALKVVKYFEAKKELFGVSKITKHITQEDLDKNDLEELFSGRFQILPIKDPAGRAIIQCFPSPESFRVDLKMLRVMFYLRTIALRDNECQKNGIVNLIMAENINGFNQDFFKKFSISDMQTRTKGMMKMVESLPGKTIAEHICYDQTNTLGCYLFSTILKFVLIAFSSFIKVRTKIHTGASFDDRLAKLQTYGIPIYFCPKSSSDKVAHIRIISHHKRFEDQGQSSECEICIPSPTDVLLGNDWHKLLHPGNIKLCTLVSEYEKLHEQCSGTIEMATVRSQIIDEIKKSRGRFLIENEFGWIRIDGGAALAKVFAFSPLSQMSSRVKKKREAKGF